MSTQENGQILRGELTQVVASVFETMLSLEVTGCGPIWYPSANRITSAVHLSGDWNGAILL